MLKVVVIVGGGGLNMVAISLLLSTAFFQYRTKLLLALGNHHQQEHRGSTGALIRMLLLHLLAMFALEVITRREPTIKCNNNARWRVALQRLRQPFRYSHIISHRKKKCYTEKRGLNLINYYPSDDGSRCRFF